MWCSKVGAYGGDQIRSCSQSIPRSPGCNPSTGVAPMSWQRGRDALLTRTLHGHTFWSGSVRMQQDATSCDSYDIHMTHMASPWIPWKKKFCGLGSSRMLKISRWCRWGIPAASSGFWHFFVTLETPNPYQPMSIRVWCTVYKHGCELPSQASLCSKVQRGSPICTLSSVIHVAQFSSHRNSGMWSLTVKNSYCNKDTGQT
jgi:hypothetical protein